MPSPQKRPKSLQNYVELGLGADFESHMHSIHMVKHTPNPKQYMETISITTKVGTVKRPVGIQKSRPTATHKK